MLDVHPPHSPINGVGEFFLHLFTITIGLLIAVGIEGAVEWHVHRELAAEAKASLTSEIRKNAKSVASALDDINREQQRLKLALAGLRKIQLDPDDQKHQDFDMDISYETTSLQDTAWRTAQVTGALAYMPYTEASRFTEIYTEAQNFLKSQDQLPEDEARFLGIIHKFHLGEGNLGKDGADAMAEEFGILQGHLLGLKISARVLQEEQNAFLEGREPSRNLTEQIKTN
jgi:hypothetical protein